MLDGSRTPTPRGARPTGTEQQPWRRARAAAVVTSLLAAMTVPLGALTAPVAQAAPPTGPNAGAFDTGFGGGDGRASLPVPRDAQGNSAPLDTGSEPVGVPVDDAGALTVALSKPANGDDSRWLLGRLDATGQPVPAYGNGDDPGLQVYDSAEDSSTPPEAVVTGGENVVSDGAGGVYVAGFETLPNGSGFSDYVTVQHFDSDGQRDAGYGNGDGTADGTAVTRSFGPPRGLTRDPAKGRLIIIHESSSGTPRWELTALTSTGAVDTTWGDLDEAGNPTGTWSYDFANPSLASSAEDLAVGAGGKVYVAGSAELPDGDFTSDDIAVARLTAAGRLDTTYGTPASRGGRLGYRTFDAGGSSESAHALFLEPGTSAATDGPLTLAGDTSAFRGTEAFAARLTPVGDLDTAWGGGDGLATLTFEPDPDATMTSSALDVVLDAQRRVVLAGEGGVVSSETAQPGLARLNPDGSTDTSFGQDGSERIDCRDTSGTAYSGSGAFFHVQMHQGAILATGPCQSGSRSDTELMQFRADLQASPSLSLDVYGVGPEPQNSDGPSGRPDPSPSPASVPAAPTSIDLSDAQIAAGLLPKVTAGVQAAPIQHSPIQHSPIQHSPIQHSPIQHSPIQHSPIQHSPFEANSPLAGTAAITLSQIPLTPPLDWTELLQDTPFEGRPLQTVLLSDVMALRAPQDVTQEKREQLSALVLQSIDLSRTPLGDAGLGAVLLGDTALRALPAPAAGWCAYLTAHAKGASPTCAPGTDATAPVLDTTTLLTAEKAGVGLQDYYALGLSLRGTTLTNAPLAYTHLADVALNQIPLGGVPVEALAAPDQFCTDCLGKGWTLRDAQDAGALIHPPAETEAGATPDPSSLQALFLTGFKASPQQASQNGTLSLGALLLGLLAPSDLPAQDLDLNPVLDAYRPELQPLLEFRSTLLMPCDAPDPRLRLTLPLGSLVRTAEVDVLGQAPRGGTPQQAGVLVTTSATAVVATFRPTPTCGGTSRVAVTLRVQAPRRLEVLTATATATGIGPALPPVARNVSVTDPSDESSGAVGTLRNDLITLGWLGLSGQADLYRLQADDRSTVRLTLSHLPADYDLIVYDDDANTSGGRPVSLPNSPGRAPIQHSPIQHSPIQHSPVDDAAPTGDGDGTADDQTVVPALDDLQGVPVLPKRIRAASTSRGTETEAVEVQLRDGEGDPANGGKVTLLVAVAPHDGASSPLPYVLSTQVDQAPAPPKCIDPRGDKQGGGFTYTEPTEATPSATATATTQSLILVNLERMTQLYGLNPAQAALLEADIRQFALQPTVLGTVVDVGRDPAVRTAYERMDQDPCSVPKINDVVTKINVLVDKVRAGAPSLRFITLIGNDDALPMGRVPDLTELGNQLEYAPAARIGQNTDGSDKDNAVSSSFAQRYLLSDDPYGALAPSAFLDTQLYVPDVAVGRVVETPTQIRQNLREYIQANGVRTLTGAYTASYDFLLDLGAEIEATKPTLPGSATDQAPDNSDTWTRQTATNKLKANPHGFTSINGHYDNNRALPADQNASGTQDDLLSAGNPSDLPPGTDPGDGRGLNGLRNAILATVGCNAGLNLSNLLFGNGSSATLGTNDPDKKAKYAARVNDWAQEITDYKGVFVGNTGFGYGDDTSISYSEKIIAAFAKNLNGSMTVGQALQFAKQQYLENAGFGVYDHKALEEATYYGLPQWRVGAQGGVASTYLPPRTDPNGPETDVTTDLTLTPNPHLVTRNDPGGSTRGDYWKVGQEQPQVTAYRPVQPRTDQVLAPRNDGTVPHGATLESLTTHEVGIDPVIAVPLVDDRDLQPEPPVGQAFFPSTLQQVVSRTNPSGQLEHALVLVPGQFRDVPLGGKPGTQRLVDTTDVRIHWSKSEDFIAPSIFGIQSGVDPDERLLKVSATLPDADTARVFALYLTNGDAPSGQSRAWSKVELTKKAGTTTWSGTALVDPGVSEIDQFYVQAVDKAGNVRIDNNKGVNFKAAEAQIVRQPGDPTPAPSPTAASPSPTAASPSASPSASRSPSPVPTTPGTGGGLPAPSVGATGQPGQVSPSPSASASAEPSTSPSAVPSPSGSASPPPVVRPTVRLNAGRVRAGSPVLVSGTAPPGTLLLIWAYSRPDTTYRIVRRLVVGDDGTFRAFLYPGTNTRLFVQADGASSDSVVVLVTPQLSMRTIGRGRTFTFTGSVKPARPGVFVTLYRQTAAGDVITAQTRTNARGVYVITRRFLGAGTFSFVIRSGGGLISLPASSPPKVLHLE